MVLGPLGALVALRSSASTASRDSGRSCEVKKTTRISKGLRQTELREVFALANVSMEAAACPYIVRYYSSWLEDGRLHIQTELCRCSLRDRLNERKAWPVASFTENEVLEVLRHVAAGLQVLHSLGFVHLDIKPDNILVARSDEGCYKIADLGLAAAAMGTGCDDITEGDCRYLAKEVLRGHLRDLPKADVFSLGLVLYELAINPRGLPSNGPEWQMIRERLEVQILSQLSQNMQLLLQEMACANKELRPTCEALLQRVGNSTPEMKALEEENRRCREEAARNKQRADSYWQEIVQMKKQELLTTSGAVPMPMDESDSSKDRQSQSCFNSRSFPAAVQCRCQFRRQSRRVIPVITSFLMDMLKQFYDDVALPAWVLGFLGLCQKLLTEMGVIQS
eukprot:s1951_g2.t3